MILEYNDKLSALVLIKVISDENFLLKVCDDPTFNVDLQQAAQRTLEELFADDLQRAGHVLKRYKGSEGGTVGWKVTWSKKAKPAADSRKN